ncbi:MAG: Rrf2 family transcriptional regulator [Clostridiales bacterium]|jgi:Rrf2 family protein|nr:Rrf2 family transcriptional regulator [Clostridiales bacterium]
MKISTRGRYGLKALIDMARRKDEKCVTVASIAQNHGISEHYLEQLFASLKKAGLVKSIRGSGGGYVLSKPPDEISVGDILRVLERTFMTVCATDDESTHVCASGNCSVCAAKPVWDKLYGSINNILESYKLSDLANGDQKESKDADIF